MYRIHMEPGSAPSHIRGRAILWWSLAGLIIILGAAAWYVSRYEPPFADTGESPALTTPEERLQEIGRLNAAAQEAGLAPLSASERALMIEALNAEAGTEPSYDAGTSSAGSSSSAIQVSEDIASERAERLRLIEELNSQTP